MSTSLHNGLRLIAAAHYGTDDDAVGAVVWRDVLANNLLHIADSYAQVRVNLSFPDTSSFASGAAEYLSGPASPTADQWFRIGAPFGPWPLTLHADGTPYVLRLRVAIATSTGTDQQTVRIVIAPDSYGAVERDRDVDHVFETTTTSATPAWVGGVTLGPIGSTTLLTVTQAQAASWLQDVSVYDAVSAGTPRSVQQCLVSAHVFAKSATTDTTTRLHRLHIAEYVGT